MRRFDLAAPRNRHWLGYILLAPAASLVVAIILYPLLLSLDLSFHDVKVPRAGQPRSPFTLENYTELLASEDFWLAAWVTVKLVAVVTILCCVLGTATALMVNRAFTGRTLARLAVALPWAIPEVIAVVIWAWIFDSAFGLLNWLLVVGGVAAKPINWFSEPAGAFFAVTVVMVWKGYPFVSIMVLAGLQAIPEDYYNAAKVDGAGTWQRFWWITLPCLAPVLIVVLVLVMLWVFRDFSIIQVLTEGGPLKTTATLSIMTYEQAFKHFRFSYAAAIGVVTLMLCLMASRLMMRRSVGSIY